MAAQRHILRRTPASTLLYVLLSPIGVAAATIVACAVVFTGGFLAGGLYQPDRIDFTYSPPDDDPGDADRDVLLLTCEGEPDSMTLTATGDTAAVTLEAHAGAEAKPSAKSWSERLASVSVNAHPGDYTITYAGNLDWKVGDRLRCWEAGTSEGGA